MESRTPRPARTTCSVPVLLLGLSKLCKLTKVCAAPDVADVKTEFGDGSGYDPKLVMVILFEAISALKSAYVKLQRAHIPYDPAKMAFADELIVSELDAAAALQCLCSTSSGVGSLVNERWLLVQELEAEARKKESDIAMLRRELEGVQRANSRLSKQIKSRQLLSARRGEVLVLPRQMAATPSAFLEMCRAAAAAVHEFAELIAGITAPSSDRGVGDAVEQRYALEARLSRTMLAGGGAGAEEEEEDQGEGSDRIMSCCDPVEALMEHPSSGFARFCRSRYLAAVSPETESAVFGNLDQRAFVARGGHPRTWFYRAFATTARSAWALRVSLKASCGVAGHAGVRVFYARRGSKYLEEHMERVAAAPGTGGEKEKLVVAFTVTPGFKIGGTVVACRVFLCRPVQRTPALAVALI